MHSSRSDQRSPPFLLGKGVARSRQTLSFATSRTKITEKVRLLFVTVLFVQTSFIRRVRLKTNSIESEQNTDEHTASEEQREREHELAKVNRQEGERRAEEKNEPEFHLQGHLSGHTDITVIHVEEREKDRRVEKIMTEKVNKNRSPQHSVVATCPVVDFQRILQIDDQNNARSDQKSKGLKINLHHSSKTIVRGIGQVGDEEDHQ